MSSQRGHSLKDQLFNEEKVRYLAGLFGQEFQDTGFVDMVMAKLPELELKARITHIAECLAASLPDDFEEAAKVIEAALPPPLDPGKSDDDFGDFIFSPLGAFVAARGLDMPEVSLPLLREITKRFSVEFDIRHFLNAHQDTTMKTMQAWAKDGSYHVRRLASEGTRPVLPWGVKVGLTLQEPIVLLDQLYKDRARFVTRSVANHLNDITKKDPDLVLDTLARWQKEGKQAPDELDWLTRHALRTLVKKGHIGALERLGYRAAPDISVALDFTKRLEIGEVGALEVVISAACDERLMVDYVIGFVKANGACRPKVFKLKKLDIKAGEQLVLKKNHRFLKEATTFRHFPGAHSVYMQINGQKFAEQEFELV
ncbi:MAG: DNA alkylation repair protein [Rhodobacteraceae bacterium]|nr:DNA alkylation repair protein [Paracoccaceae bacterium]